MSRRRLVLASRTRWARPVSSVAWNVLGVFVWARIVRAACVRVGGRGAFPPTACPERVLAGALQVNVVALTASKRFATSNAGANPVLSCCADNILAIATRFFPAGIARPFVAVEGVVAYDQRLGSARNAYAATRVACIEEGLVTDVGECWVGSRQDYGPFERLKGIVADVFKQQGTRQVDVGGGIACIL